MTLPPPLGTIHALAGEIATTLTPAWARVAAGRVNHQHHRAPYGSDWWVSGTGERQPIVLEITIMAYAATITDAAAGARSVIASIEGATRVVLPFGLFVTLGVLGWSASPTEAGYRLDVRVAAENERPEGFLLTYGGDPVTYGGDRVAYLGG